MEPLKLQCNEGNRSFLSYCNVRPSEMKKKKAERGFVTHRLSITWRQYKLEANFKKCEADKMIGEVWHMSPDLPHFTRRSSLVLFLLFWIKKYELKMFLNNSCMGKLFSIKDESRWIWIAEVQILKKNLNQTETVTINCKPSMNPIQHQYNMNLGLNYIKIEITRTCSVAREAFSWFTLWSWNHH